MKLLLRAICAVLLCLPLGVLGQAFTQRTNGTFTPTDPFLNVSKGLYIPRVCDTIGAVKGLDTLGAIIYDKCHNVTYIRDTLPGTHYWRRIGPVIANYGTHTQTGDTIQLGDSLTASGYPVINTPNQRRFVPQTGTKALLFTNVAADSILGSTGNNGSSSNTFAKPNLAAGLYFGDNDTLPKVYGGNIYAFTRQEFSPGRKSFVSSSTPYVMPYSGFYGISQLFPPDTLQWYCSPYGMTGSAIVGDFGLGNTNPYYITIQSPLYPNYPITVQRLGFDYARNNTSLVKRDLRGSGTAGLVWDYRSQQQLITSGSTDLGSYTNKIYGIYAYGSLWPHWESPSKLKTLAVSTIDSAFAFYADSLNGALNEVKNGYAFAQVGGNDYNYLAGYTKMGGTMQSSLNPQGFRVHIDSTLRIGANLSNGAFFTKYWRQQGVTNGNFTNQKKFADFTTFEFSFDEYVNLSSSLITSNITRLNMFARDSMQVSAFVTGLGCSSAEFGLLLRKQSGFTDTTKFVGATVPLLAAGAFTTRLDMSATSIAGRENIAAGWFSAINPTIQLAAFNQIENAMWINVGAGQFPTNSLITNARGIYINPMPTIATNKYAINQEGTADSVILKGLIQTPNLTQVDQAATYKSVVVDANGNQFKVNPLTGSAALDFPSTSAQTSSDLTISVTGAADGDVVALGVPNAAVGANSSFTAWVSSSNTVTVRFNNYSSGAIDPASATFNVRVIK